MPPMTSQDPSAMPGQSGFDPVAVSMQAPNAWQAPHAWQESSAWSGKSTYEMTEAMNSPEWEEPIPPLSNPDHPIAGTSAEESHARNFPAAHQLTHEYHETHHGVNLKKPTEEPVDNRQLQE